MEAPEALQKMLGNLDRWRHFPKYQLERRADLFFSLFLREIVQHSGFTGQKQLHRALLPEFPYKNVEERHTTVNFDYVLFSEELDTAYIVELKTDPESSGDVNNPYLAELEDGDITFTDIISGLVRVARKSPHKLKYQRLLEELQEIGVVEKDENGGWRCIRQMGKPVIVYLAPGIKKTARDQIRLIDFHQAAATLEALGGEVEQLLAAHLRQWQDIKAGHSAKAGTDHG